MGRILRIRVSADSGDGREVAQAWPGLCSLAWPGQGEVRRGEWIPVTVPPPIGPSMQAGLDDKAHRHGVLELAEALSEQYRFGSWPSEQKARLKDGMDRLHAARNSLEAALGDWKAAEALKASDAVEDALDDMEKLLE